MRVIIVGGFLGAGKTTLMAQAAKHFAAEGKQVGIITNDQAADLVDTHLLSATGIAVREVAGGCFCCRFEDLERASKDLIASMHPEVLLTEPVGSCTDISATVLQPMKQKWGRSVELSLYSVLVDPKRILEVLDEEESSFPESVRYIIRKQIEEADCLVINKTDLLSQDELALVKEKIASHWPDLKTLEMSALHNQGVSEWIETISKSSIGGRKILEINYDTYASGEAEMGWLNTSISLVAHEKTDWGAFARDLIGRIHSELFKVNAEIGHLKILISTPAGQVIANATSIHAEPEVRAAAEASAGTASLIVNARAHIDPQRLNSILELSIRSTVGNSIEASDLALHSFKPAYPKPTYRFDTVIDQS
jgi:G3E family GTPase